MASDKGAVRRTWGRVTGNEMARLAGQHAYMLGVLQEKYGYTRQEAQQALNQLLATYDETKNRLVNTFEQKKAIPPGGSDSINVFFNPTGVTNVNASLGLNANDPEGVFSAQLAGASSQRGWVLKVPLTTNNTTALGVRVISDTLAFALTSADLYKSTNNGASWQVMATPAGTFRTMFWVDANEGYIGGGTFSIPLVTTGSSFIYRTTNSGVSWTTEYSASDFPVEKIDVLSGGTGYAVTVPNFRIFNSSGSVLKTTNSGLSWFTAAKPGTGISIATNTITNTGVRTACNGLNVASNDVKLGGD